MSSLECRLVRLAIQLSLRGRVLWSCLNRMALSDTELARRRNMVEGRVRAMRNTC